MTTAELEQPTEAVQPEVKGGVVPYLVVEGAVKAGDFYARAFGAQEAGRHPVDEQGRTMHLHLWINGNSVMFSDPFPEHCGASIPAQGFTLHMQVEDVDGWWERAVAAGCEVVLPLQLMFWGQRYGQVRDPFGISWSLAAPMR